MQSDYLSDIDELVLRFRTESARKYVQEAVRCYKSGAFRGCVVMTWIAVVYDFVDKLRELELAGDKKASQTLAEFAKCHGLENIERALKFERGLLEAAKTDFELISGLEFVDLRRLQEDRHRCAHPAFLETGEPYQPTAELARLHLRNAVAYLLLHPPVQGKAAMDRLIADVKSEFFPRSRADAVSLFAHGPLARPRAALVRNFIIAILKQFLIETDTDTRRRYIATIGAVIELHRAVAESTLVEKLSDILCTVSDDNLQDIIFLLDGLPEMLPFVREDVFIRLKNFISSLSVKELPHTFNRAGRIRALHAVIEQREATLSYSEVAASIAANPSKVRAQVIARALELYKEVGGWDSANALGDALSKVCTRLSAEQVEAVLQATENHYVRTSFKLEMLVLAIKKAKLLTSERIHEILTSADVHKIHPELVQDEAYAAEEQ